MAELEPGHPDELLQLLRNIFQQAHASEGELLPHGIDPLEWAARRFIESWRKPTHEAIESIEGCINRALNLCYSGGSLDEIKNELETARQTIGEDLRDELGLYEWNNE